MTVCSERKAARQRPDVWLTRRQAQRARQVPDLRSRARHPGRARAYLVTDEAVSETVSRYAPLRLPLDEIWLRSLSERPMAGQSPPAAATPLNSMRTPTTARCGPGRCSGPRAKRRHPGCGSRCRRFTGIDLNPKKDTQRSYVSILRQVSAPYHDLTGSFTGLRARP